MYTTVILLLIWGWGVYLAVKAIHDVRTSQGIMSWVLLLLLVPPIGIPLYMLLGDRRLEGYVRARRGGWSKLDSTAQIALKSLKEHENPPRDATLKLLSDLAKLPWTSGNTVKTYVAANQFYADMIADIERATSYVLVQFYIYRDDESGQALRDALTRASQRGIKVYMMYDELGCAGTPAAFFEPVTKAGGCLSGFKTVPRKRRLLRLNFRNHRKLVVVDGVVAFFGGMNVGDEYRGLDESIGRWRDTHARAVGPAAMCAQLVFLEDWHWAQEQTLSGVEWTVKESARPHQEDGEQVNRMLLFPSGPIDDREAGVLMFLQLISRASKRLWIATPYFVCEESIIQAITLAKLRGVDVRILVPEKPDSKLVLYAAQSFMRDAIAAKIPVYRYSVGFTHQKVVISDNIASIGSANLDHRSMKLNFELTGIVDDEEFADQVAKMIEHDMARAAIIPAIWWDSLTSWQRFRIRFARMAAPIM